jgi:hemoglobin-like flavoprotein
MTMSNILSERTIDVLRASLPVVEAHRSRIVDGMAASFAAADPVRGEPRAACAAATLVDMLIDQVRHFAAGEGPRDIDAIRLEHARNGISRSHHARFGDAIAAVMVDAAGAALPKLVGGAWCAAFWNVIRRMKESDANGPAVKRARAPGGQEAEPLKILA